MGVSFLFNQTLQILPLQPEHTSKSIKIFFIYNTTSIPICFIKKDDCASDIYIDVESGYETNYFDNGIVESEGNIIYGCRIGIWYCYTKSGILISKKYYSKLDKNNIADKVEVF